MVNDKSSQLTGCAANIARMLSSFSDKREGLIWIYLLSVADEEGRVDYSVNAMALQLDMHRQTLMRFINRLCDKGYAKWEFTATTRHPNRLLLNTIMAINVTKDVTEDVTMVVADDVTDDVASSTDRHDPVMHCLPERFGNNEFLPLATDVTADVTENVTAGVTKREKEQTKEENPPAPPKKEKKQEKDKNTHTTACAREKNLEQRRQRFLASLLPYLQHYGQEMVQHFCDYWTEPNRSMTKMRFELQRTWSTPLRLSTWARNDKIFTTTNNNHFKQFRHTAADFIADAQRTAIEETERFIREAEMRRGGLRPHLPY